MQWARHRIRVNTVAPGFFRSEITAELYDSEKGSAWLRRGTLLPDEGRAEDMVGAVLWLVSDAGRYTTGQTIVVDGGWTAVSSPHDLAAYTPRSRRIRRQIERRGRSAGPHGHGNGVSVHSPRVRSGGDAVDGERLTTASHAG